MSQKDIRAFFAPQKHKQSSKKITSDDPDVIPCSPNESNLKTKLSLKSRKRKIIDSDSDEEDKKRAAKEKVNKVKAADVFGNAPVKQAKVEKKIEKRSPEKVKPETELGIHDDPDFERSLLELDNDLLIDNIDVLDKSINDTLHNTSSMVMGKKRSRGDEYEDDGVDRDQERYEKRRQSGLLYQKYLNRTGPANHGQKEYPKGKPNCLGGLCFLRTGVLDSLEGEEFDGMVKEYGGRTVHAVSRKVNYIVTGVEPGPAKLEKAHNFGIPLISEDEFLDLILTKSGMRPKYGKKDELEEQETERKEVKSVRSNKNVTEMSTDISQKDTSLAKEVKKKRDEEGANSERFQNNAGISSKTSHKEKPKEIKKEVKSPEVKKESFYGKKAVIEVDSDEIKDFEKEPTVPKLDKENLSWADKYKPQDTKRIIGQQGDKSCMRKLLHWLSKWSDNHSGKNKPKLVKPSPWSKSDDGAYFKCALLSGPPGIGKTTTATLVAKELGFDIVEFNASDTRSKRLLHEEVSQLLSTNSLAGFLKDGSDITKKRVLLMDEVDGMAGNEDRGGMQELIQLIKNSSVPIICMCNDRNHPKIRSLANYCFDLRFSRPRLEQIRAAMMSVCCKEGLKIKPDALSQIINGTGMDMRQTLNHLSMWTVNNKSLSVEEAQKEATAAQKDTILGPWEVVRKVFSEEEHKTMSLSDKFRLFFFDYSIGPLFVQENYLQVQPHCAKQDILKRASYTADSISKSDLVDRKIRNGNNWSLLETQALYSSVLPGHYMEGHVKGQINFPGWLGKNSKKGKFKRLISELQAHMRISTSGSRKSVNLDYIYHLRNAIVKPLADKGAEGIEAAMEVMHSYNLLREDLDSIMEVSHWARQKDPMAMVDSKVKAAFTRAYNKDNAKLPYSASSIGIKKKISSNVEENPYEDEEVDSSPEDDQDITKDAMIKAKKKKPTTEASTSKKAANTKGGRGGKKKK